MCRGPVQVLREDADANRQKRGLSTEKGRARLEAFMQDCPGDHILFLRIFEVQTQFSRHMLLLRSDIIQSQPGYNQSS